MADDFIPFNQSTPIQGRWQERNQNKNQRFSNNRFQNDQSRSGGYRHYNNRRGNNSHRSFNNSSFSDNSTSFSERNNIDAYLHPSMLEDPWAHLKQKPESN